MGLLLACSAEVVVLVYMDLRVLRSRSITAAAAAAAAVAAGCGRPAAVEPSVLRVAAGSNEDGEEAASAH